MKYLPPFTRIAGPLVYSLTCYDWKYLPYQLLILLFSEKIPDVISMGVTNVVRLTSKCSSNERMKLKLRSKHRKTLQAIFAHPVRAGIPWTDIESLLVACGAEISEGQGSRVRIVLNNVRAVFHRPHPRKETEKGAVRAMRRFLTEAGVEP